MTPIQLKVIRISGVCGVRVKTYRILHVNHLLTLAARNQKWLVGFQGFAGCSFHLLFWMSDFVLEQMPLVVGSGS
jgi:hypothetical protein